MVITLTNAVLTIPISQQFICEIEINYRLLLHKCFWEMDLWPVGIERKPANTSMKQDLSNYLKMVVTVSFMSASVISINGTELHRHCKSTVELT